MGHADYEKIEVVGEGTFGVVTRARVIKTGQEVAIKKIRKPSGKNGADLSTLRETMLLAELRHQHVIELKEAYSHNSALSLVFEFCVTDLEKILRDKTAPLDTSRIKGYLLGAFHGLAFCHANWVLHRDLKPGNLLLNASGHVKLADFGLARFYGSPGRKFTGQVVTRWYRPPELLFGAKHYGPAVDLWSMGCIFAELMTRAPLFPGGSDIDQLSRVFSLRGTPTDESWPAVSKLPDYIQFKEVAPVPLPTRFPAASPAALRLLGDLLSLDPEQRPSADEALAHAFFDQAPPAASPAELVPRARPPAAQQRGEKRPNPDAR